MDKNLNTAYGQTEENDSLKKDSSSESTCSTSPLHDDVADPGLDALILIARYHNIASTAQQLRHAAGLKSERFDEKELSLAARSLSLKTRIVKTTIDRLPKTPMPALALDKDGNHFILAKCDTEKALVLEHKAQSPTMSTPGGIGDVHENMN
jgi:ATP-binding cassette, subfamily B, bacterial HlyB/CyaB